MPKKRANGEGNIRKRKDGRWEGRFTAGRDPETGRQIFKNVLGRTQAEVKDKLRKAQEAAKGIDFTKTESYTVEEWMRIWFETYSKPQIRETTAACYTNYIEHHIIPGIGHIKLEKLTSRDIQKMYNHIKTNGRVPRYNSVKEEGLSNRFVRGTHMVLPQALDQAVKERIIPSNPTNGCRIPQLEKKEMKVIAPEQVGSYLNAAKENGVLPMFYLELTSGLRRGELLALLWEDLDIAERTISVTKTLSAKTGKMTVSPPKTQNSIRKVVIPTEAVELLVEEHEKHPDSPYMFPSPVTGNMYHPDAIGRVHKKLLKQAGLPDIRFHDLRHTFATLALQNGVDVKTLSSMLGHYSAGFTLDTYTHATMKMQIEAADKLGGFMAQTV